MNGFLESNREELGISKWLSLPHIVGGLDIPDEMAKTTTRNKLIMLPSGNITRTANVENKDAIRKVIHMISNI